ncbi:hypothetical protein JTB14_007642 [Gonioctena quinquepunctata]|nr:hypothetical protein JTB14_007642 [Gonioctena quinquepunctata]
MPCGFEHYKNTEILRKIVCNIGECRGRHNRLEHIDVERADKTNEHSEGRNRTEKNSEHSESGDFHFSGFVGNQYSALLKIVKVKLYGQENNIETYALLDEGSTVTLIDSSIAEILKLHGPTSPICLQWTNQMTQDEEYSKMVHLEIAGVESGKKFRLRNARTVKNLTLPKQKLDIDFICEKYDYIDRSVLEMIDNAEPKMLIGQDNIGLITCQKIIHPKFDQLATSKTRLGELNSKSALATRVCVEKWSGKFRLLELLAWGLETTAGLRRTTARWPNYIPTF